MKPTPAGKLVLMILNRALHVPSSAPPGEQRFCRSVCEWGSFIHIFSSTIRSNREIINILCFYLIVIFNANSKCKCKPRQLDLPFCSVSWPFCSVTAPDSVGKIKTLNDSVGIYKKTTRNNTIKRVVRITSLFRHTPTTHRYVPFI